MVRFCFAFYHCPKHDSQTDVWLRPETSKHWFIHWLVIASRCIIQIPIWDALTIAYISKINKMHSATLKGNDPRHPLYFTLQAGKLAEVVHLSSWVVPPFSKLFVPCGSASKSILTFKPTRKKYSRRKTLPNPAAFSLITFEACPQQVPLFFSSSLPRIFCSYCRRETWKPLSSCMHGFCFWWP